MFENPGKSGEILFLVGVRSLVTEDRVLMTYRCLVDDPQSLR